MSQTWDTRSDPEGESHFWQTEIGVCGWKWSIPQFHRSSMGKSDDQPLDLSKFSGTLSGGTWGAAGPRFPGRSERGS